MTRSTRTVFVIGLVAAIMCVVCVAFGVCGAYLAGYHKGVVHERRRSAPLLSPTTAAPYGVECDHGVNVYTTPQGGIAVFPGGIDCRG